jgi:hypothetical protein
MPARSLSRWLLPSLADMLFAGVLVLAALYGPRMLNIDGDLGRHLTIGGYMLDTLSIPTADLWSHTRAGAPLVPHEWLAEVALALAARAAGLPGVVWLVAVLLAVTFWGQARWLLGRGFNVYVVIVFVLWAAAASSLHWLTRPHVFTYPFVLAFAWTLDDWRRAAAAPSLPPPQSGEGVGGSRRWWWLPVLMLVWANTHGAFIAGFVLIGLHGAAAGWAWLVERTPAHARWLRDLALALVLCVAASLVNPTGPALVLNSFGYVGNRYLVDHTVEYLAPDFHQVATWPFAGLVFASVILAALPGRHSPSREAGEARGGAPLLVLLIWLGFGLYSMRNIPLFAIAGVPVLVELADGALAGAAESGRRWAQALAASARRLSRTDAALAGGGWAVAAAVIMAVVFVARPPDFYRFSPRVFPVAAADELAAHPPPGRMFNDFIWGGYLLYRLWPAQQVFIDGQTDFYGEALTREYAQVSAAAPGWQQVLARYDVTWIIVPVDGPLAQRLSAGDEPGWVETYRDETAVIFMRDAR